VLGVLVLSMLTMNRRVTRHRNYLRDTLLSIGDAVVTLDAKGHIDFMNRPARNLACASKQGQQTARFDERFSLEDAVTGLPISLSQAALRHAEQAGLALRSRSAVLDCDHGRVTDLKLTVTPVHDEHRNTRGWVVVMHDITQMQQLARRLGHQATHDDLTGLVNRREFTRRLQSAIDTAARGRHEHVMCFIDLDQFKIVNDTCGHEAGDRLLKQLSSLLRSKLRAHDTVARLGGDEFGVLMEDCGLERGEAIAEHLRGAVETHRFEWDGKLFGVGASIGVVSVSAESGTLAELMSFADTACFAAKEQGRNRVQVHRSGDLAVDGRHRALNWAQRITRALQEDGWVLFVQPIMEPGGQGEQRRFEVLVRMRGEDGDLILPRAFLAAAERFNLMPALDRWVVEHALAMIRRIQPLHPSFGWSLNLSGQTLDDPRFADFVIEQLRASGVAGSSICFEITERAAIANLSTATSFMARMKEQGVRFALDDFGSGLSSFCCLNDLPVDYLKIDGSIVKQAASNSVSRAVAASIQSIARSMGIATIAELVSNEEIRHVMEEIGVSYAQGKIMGPPHEMSLLLEPPEQAIGVAPLQPPAAGFQPTAES
jgi:Amt family ammonium transporter